MKLKWLRRVAFVGFEFRELSCCLSLAIYAINILYLDINVLARHFKQAPLRNIKTLNSDVAGLDFVFVHNCAHI